MLASEINNLLNKFGAALALANLTEDSFEGVLSVIKTEIKKNGLCLGGAQHPGLVRALFKYEESESSYQFFLPYIW